MTQRAEIISLEHKSRHAQREVDDARCNSHEALQSGNAEHVGQTRAAPIAAQEEKRFAEQNLANARLAQRMTVHAAVVAAREQKSAEAQRNVYDAQRKLDEVLKSGTADDVAKARAASKAAQEAKHIANENYLFRSHFLERYKEDQRGHPLRRDDTHKSRRCARMTHTNREGSQGNKEKISGWPCAKMTHTNR